ncbi:hypothetical protein [Agarilytica rhodophyticola]|uniref:hypothetical protein n=1 Tax=Agarilytica rhodophyticola TaxID=1737490 RepID=UPI000B3449FA|nr:hypothetical protein [Agarilytica rhodophyticola]
MKKAIFLNMAFIIVSLFTASTQVFAADTLGIKVDSPTWCRGQNSLGQCVTFFGSKDACNNVEPCKREAAERYITPVITGDLHYCYGMNSLDQCVLFLGSEKSCAHVEPCIFKFEHIRE